MSKIQVTCAGCFKRFEVSEKFAGKEGPCPKCGKTIRIPLPEEQVTLRENESFGGVKDTSGKLVLKPIGKEDVKFSPVVTGIVVFALVVVLGMAFMFRAWPAQEKTPLVILGSLAIAVPICWSGYWFLRDDELEPHQGTSLWVRVLLCSVCYAAIWAGYAFFVGYFDLNHDDLPFLSTMVVVCVALGTFVAAGCFDIEPLSGFLHYAFYLVVTVVLRMALGLDAHFTRWWE